jgi:predicted O-linked N-acetylglucosamine transferase (SPINDLY family)
MADYEALALRLARRPELLQALRTRLADNRLTHPLFDPALFARGLEKAYMRMVTRSRKGLKPEGFDVT